MAYRAQFEQWVPLPLEQVFRFFGDPRNLPRIMPEWMQVELEDVTIVPPPDSPPGSHFAGAGSSLKASYRAAPFLSYRIRSEARIVGFGLNEFFEDVQASGPFKSWHHRHEFAAEERDGVNGTRLRDVIDYEVGFGFLGTIGNAMFIRRQMESTFAERQNKLPQLLR